MVFAQSSRTGESELCGGILKTIGWYQVWLWMRLAKNPRRSFADDVNNQVHYVGCRIFVGEMTPHNCTQAKAASFDFVTNNRQNQRLRLGPKIFIRYMLILA